MNDDPDSPRTDYATAVRITRAAGDWRRSLPDVESLVTCAARAAVAAAGAAPGRGGNEISILLTDDASVAALNAAHRGQARPTNVLAFPQLDRAELALAASGQSEGAVLLGDVVLAWETVAREAAAAERPFGDHLAHLVIHGVLHLLGHDHMNDGEAEIMEGLEALALGALGIAAGAGAAAAAG